MSDLADPRRVGHGAPARADPLERVPRRRAGAEQRRVLLPALHLRGADDRRVHARHAEREAERGARGRVPWGLQELVVERPQARPVSLVVGLGRLPRVPPRGVGQRPLGDDAHRPLTRQRQRELDGLLVRDADGGLERVEAAGLDRIARRLAVAAVADVPREAPLARLLESADRVAPPELGERAAVELDEVDVVGREAAQAALDAGEERGGPPVLAREAAGVAALGEEVALAPPPADGAADEGLAVLVTL